MHKILVIDVGGTHIKLLATGQEAPRKFASGPDLTPSQMVPQILEAIQGWEFDAVSIGYPGPIVHGKAAAEPHNLGAGWVGFDFEAAFGCPVKMMNDAAMQALGSYKGGKMLFLGLGTGLGSALVVDGQVLPMELSHLPYRKKFFEYYVGVGGLQRRGKKKWRKSVHDVVERLTAALLPEYVIIGGGNVKLLKHLPAGAQATQNSNAFTGGFRLWEEQGHDDHAETHQ